MKVLALISIPLFVACMWAALLVSLANKRDEKRLDEKRGQKNIEERQ